VVGVGATAPLPAPSSSPTSTGAPRDVEISGAGFSCGPTDGLWVQATVTADVAIGVRAVVVVDGVVEGSSPTVDLVADVPTPLGIDPLAAYTPGALATLRIVAADAAPDDPPLATVEIVLDLPPGVTCG
jgi:hypothetical protein